MLANQFWLAWFLQFRRFESFLFVFKNGQNFPSDIVHGGQKIESAQKIHASMGWHEMLANQFWWAWFLQFRRFESFLFAFKNGQNFPSDHGL